MSLNLIVNVKHFTFKQLSSTITVVVLYIINSRFLEESQCDNISGNKSLEKCITRT